MMRTTPVKPFATRFPWYLRLRAGTGVPFTHFVFAKNWRDTPESYIQILPHVSVVVSCPPSTQFHLRSEMDRWTLGVNDILSFYKEELVGGTHNYVRIRSAADQTSPEIVLRQLIEEVVDTARRVDIIVADDAGLSNIWTPYKKAYIEFHLKTPRYRLAELGFSP
ncbi:hypothetical protein C8Q79DRAFT_470852 [Trametes meyenii]|nr:hypothetical protein C8Q79DRAFT_470852 [Trametes meyenii]